MSLVSWWNLNDVAKFSVEVWVNGDLAFTD